MNKPMTCKNCGGDIEFHQGLTGKCPAGGHKATAGMDQEWMDTVFEPEVHEGQTKRIIELEKQLKDALERLKALEDINKRK